MQRTEVHLAHCEAYLRPRDAIFNPELKKRFQVEPSEPTDEVVCPAWQLDCLILFEEAIPIEDPRSGSNFGEITRTQKENILSSKAKRICTGEIN